MDRKNMLISIDNEGDILIISKRDSYPEQTCEELQNDIIVRKNPNNTEIELIQIMNFSERFASSDVFEVPIVAQFISNGDSYRDKSASSADPVP